MTQNEPETATAASGSSMVRLTDTVGPATPDLAVLAPLDVEVEEPTVASGKTFWRPGQVLRWHYRKNIDMVRVVRDDERGLVTWLPAGSERWQWRPRDGGPARGRPASEVVAMLRDGEVDWWQTVWKGTGVLRISPTAKPWTIVFFYEADGSFAGHYVNIETLHQRAAEGSPRLYTRDLLLDLWLGAEGDLWLKDADELAAAVEVDWFEREQAEVIGQIADQVRHEVLQPRVWPLDEGWERYAVPAEWDVPLKLRRPERTAIRRSLSG